ncbi:MoaD/ThiS family protein [Agromyces silvae]|uniref:MoaD/ThiS family protein n=1 Tax=Agromyces silvae TaxID=3388266 RepID=UPI00280B86AF|nr:MoaD/ThiS family protein [Agromyces protaetiae]
MSGVVTVRYFAGAAEAAGREEELIEASDLGSLRDAITRRHGDALARVLGRCSLLVDGRRADAPGTPLPAGATIDVLPPFAGG